MNFSISRSSLASYILGLDVNTAKNKKHVEEMFFSVFSALLDALLLRAQVCSNELVFGFFKIKV